MLCGTTPCDNILSDSMLCGTTPCGSVLCDSMLCGTTQCGYMLCGTTPCGSVLCDSILCGNRQWGCMLCGTTPCGSILCGCIFSNMHIIAALSGCPVVTSDMAHIGITRTFPLHSKHVYKDNVCVEIIVQYSDVQKTLVTIGEHTLYLMIPH